MSNLEYRRPRYKMHARTAIQGDSPEIAAEKARRLAIYENAVLCGKPIPYMPRNVPNMDKES